MRKFLSAIGAVLLASVASPAAAATYDITVAIGEFSPAPAPVPVVLADFTLQLDPALDSAGSGGITMNHSNLLIDSALEYSYTASSDTLLIGGSSFKIDSVFPGTNDIVLGILGLNSASPTLTAFFYSLAGDSGTYFSSTGVVHVDVSGISAVPIPAALPLFISALGGLGYFGWRRRKSSGA